MRIIFLINHSSEWLELVAPIINDSVASGVEVVAFWESEYAYRLLKNKINVTSNIVLPQIIGPHCNKNNHFYCYDFHPDQDRLWAWGYGTTKKNIVENYASQISKSILDFLDKRTIVVYEQNTCFFASIVAAKCGEKGAKYIGLQMGRFPGLTELHDKNGFVKLSQSELILDGLTSICSSGAPLYMNNLKHGVNRFLKYFRAENFRRILIATLFFKKSYSVQIRYPIFTYLKWFVNGFKQLMNYYFYEHFLPVDVEQDKFYLYPLHYHPEASTSRAAWWIDSELSLINVISRALTNDEYLILKIHPSATGQLNKSFYSAIKKLNNVNIVRHDAKLDDLLNACSGVISINSTLIFDALNKNKPVLYFGEFPVAGIDGLFAASIGRDLNLTFNKFRSCTSIDSDAAHLQYRMNCIPKNIQDISYQDLINISKVVA